MAFMLAAPGTTGGLVNYGDLLQAIKQSSAVVNTNNTAGVADTLSGAQIANGFYIRSGATAAVAATTDTAANIITAMGPNAFVGQTAVLFYTNQNTSSGAVTFTGGTGVTLAGLTVVPISQTATIVVTITSTTSVGFNVIANSAAALPVTNYVTQSGSNQTALAGELLAAQNSSLNLSANGANAYTTRTGAQMAADIPNIVVGQTWRQRILANGNNTVTLTAAISGVTITGTATATTGTYRDYVVTYTAANTFVFQNIGGGSV